MTGFTAEVFQNEYLPAGSDTVDAVVTLRSGTGHTGGAVDTTPRVEIIIIDTSGSMSEEGGQKMRSARSATAAAIDVIDDGVSFAVVGGNHEAYMIYPSQGLAVSSPTSRQEAKIQVNRVQADGGTAIGTWLRAAASLVPDSDAGIGHALLLTDGKNQHESKAELQSAIDAARGKFQCDARGLGADWNVDELRRVANGLLGSVDIIPKPEDMEAEFTSLIKRSMTNQVGRVALRLWTPKGSICEFVKQVAPQVEDLSGRAEPVDELSNDYPLGAWGANEERDYHLRIRVPVGGVGDERLAARVSLVVDWDAQPAALIKAIWTNDENLSTRINREVAHYTGQAELADVIAAGLAAKASGNEADATVKLGRAVQIAHESGNDDTVRLLQKVVEIDNPATGTVRLRRDVDKTDEMALDVRSTRTVRVNRSQ